MKKTSNKIILITLSLLLAGSLILSAGSLLPGGTNDEPTPTPEPVIAEETGVVAEGNIVPRDTARLAFIVSGEVSEVLVEEGDRGADAADRVCSAGNHLVDCVDQYYISRQAAKAPSFRINP